ncbi:MAG: acetylglutamate kinase [candidate division NC10 bacterium]|nr:acetylglutamate kinase [candidate division NC10 bacterium]MBI2164018.1 acetylglutamate kinase [candidate division NC10 bacterium]MBI2458860.1 acetylglutamate kinase [candidate division NC10 bacterium]MBI3085476.1 acetylglutamate kinase [candidate division NC10 bacterium]
MASPASRAEIIIGALPFIRAFSGKTVVVKYGGNAMVDRELTTAVIQDLILMRLVGMQPVVVHGGGPQIDQTMKTSGMQPRFVQGLRITDADTMRIVERVLVGEINQEIVAWIQRLGGAAIGLSGKDGGLIQARKAAPVTAPDGQLVDLGLVGDVARVDPRPIRTLQEAGYIPVVAPTAGDETGATYNINADLVAGEVAAALVAEKLVLLTDTDGILDRQGRLLSTLTRQDVERLMADGTINRGMLPKVQACLTALKAGVQKTHIINGTRQHALIEELLTPEGVGTEIVA